MEPTATAVAAHPVAVKAKGEDADSASEPAEEEVALEATRLVVLAVLRALLAKRAERSADLANMVTQW